MSDAKCYIDEKNEIVYCYEFLNAQLQNEFYPYCPFCGFHLEQEDKSEKNTWLWEGCAYEIDDINEATLLRYYSKKNKLGKPEFVNMKNNVGSIGCCYDNYRPLGTPLGFAPYWAAYIEININGDFKFKEKFSASTDWIRWHNCPEGIKGTTLLIPEDWRIKK